MNPKWRPLRVTRSTSSGSWFGTADSRSLTLTKLDVELAPLVARECWLADLMTAAIVRWCSLRNLSKTFAT
jgi:hypothetical protein